MRKIVFLDIDGVLNSKRYDRTRGENDGNIDESRMPLLKQIIDETGAEIVLSSSWRKHWEPSEKECDENGKILNGIFGKFGLQISAKTPMIASERRGDEVLEWLDKNGKDVVAFVILDDYPFGWGSLTESLIKTDKDIGRGLEERHVLAAIDRLNEKNS